VATSPSRIDPSTTAAQDPDRVVGSVRCCSGSRVDRRRGVGEPQGVTVDAYGVDVDLVRCNVDLVRRKPLTQPDANIDHSGSATDDLRFA
jgi:hypothetical protein